MASQVKRVVDFVSAAFHSTLTIMHDLYWSLRLRLDGKHFMQCSRLYGCRPSLMTLYNYASFFWYLSHAS